MSTLLITGGAGFVLCHLAHLWTRVDPDNRVIVLDAVPPPPEVMAHIAHPRLSVQIGSTTDPQIWRSLPDPAQITHIVHGAAVTSMRSRVAAQGIAGAIDPLQINIIGTMQALAYAQSLPDLRRCITLSSGVVYARLPGTAAVPETAPLNPEGWYGVSKHTAEALTHEAALLGLPVHSVRLSSVFGALDRATPSRQVQSIPHRLCHAARSGQPLTLAGLHGGGDFLSAPDVAAGLQALLTCATASQPVYNLAHGQFTTLQSLAEMTPGLLWSEGKDHADITADPTDLSGRNGAYAIDAMTADTGWKPTPLPESIAAYSDWLTHHPF